MRNNAKSIPLWFIALSIPMVGSQIVRLHQTLPLNWLICDYAGRLGALLILLAIPAARAVAFRPRPLRISWWELVFWIGSLVAIFTVIDKPILNYASNWLPNTRLGHYPNSKGWLRAFDLFVGLWLVAYHEEIVFRRCASEIFGASGNDVFRILASSLLFTAYHWWTGITQMSAMFFFGICMMIFLMRTGAIWPLVLTHYLVDLIWFSVLT